MKFILCLVSAFSLTLSSQARDWLTKSGTEISGEYVKYSKGFVIIKRDGGKLVKINYKNLSDKDRKFVKDKVVASKKTNSKPAGNHTVGALIDDLLVDMNGKKVKKSLSRKKYVIFYYSAKWCPPCQKFTPSLVKYYNENKNANFELVFVSSDRDAKSMFAYMKEKKMSFPALEFNQARNAKVNSYTGRGIPFLAVIDASGKAVIKENAFLALPKIQKLLGK